MRRFTRSVYPLIYTGKELLLPASRPSPSTTTTRTLYEPKHTYLTSTRTGLKGKRITQDDLYNNGSSAATTGGEALDTIEDGERLSLSAAADSNNGTSANSGSTSKRKKGAANSKTKSNSKVHRKRAVIETPKPVAQEASTVEPTVDAAIEPEETTPKSNPPAPPRQRMSRKKKEIKKTVSNAEETKEEQPPPVENGTAEAADEERIGVEEYLMMLNNMGRETEPEPVAEVQPTPSVMTSPTAKKKTPPRKAKSAINSKANASGKKKKTVEVESVEVATKPKASRKVDLDENNDNWIETMKNGASVPEEEEVSVAKVPLKKEKDNIHKTFLIDEYTFAPPVYYTARFVDINHKPTEEELTKERASVTKLCVVADSITCLFRSLPHSDPNAGSNTKRKDSAVGDSFSGPLNEYINQVDAAMIPSSVFSPLNVGREETTTHDVDCDRVEGEEDTEALLDVMQRVLVEDSANNAVDIHVREMEQLTPPPELLADDDVAAEKSKPVEEPKKKGKGSRKRKAEPIPEPPKALSPLERVVALQKWRAEAAECSRQSQSSQQIQSDSHVITRVRLHQPYKTDIAVVQGFGGRKGVDDVLATLNRMLKREGEEEGGAKVGQLVPLRQMGLTFDNKGHFISVDGAQQYFSPFVLRPLLSVYASCLPRREPLLGCRTDEKAFLGFQKEEEGTTTAPDAPLSLSDAALYARLKAMYVPSMPRHSTLITVLVEHDTDLQPIDLISMAEITSFRKDNDEKTTSSSSDALGGKKATTKSKKKRYHIYCLISDGKRV